MKSKFNSLSKDARERERERIYQEEIKPDFLDCIGAAKGSPKVVFLAGQPGAGKSRITRLTQSELSETGEAVVIDPDKFRAYHPEYKNFLKENDQEAAELTHEDASWWAERLQQDAIRKRTNVIVDGTLKNKENAAKRVNTFKENGYSTQIRALAVNEEISELSVQKRYEDEKAAAFLGVEGAQPRQVPKEVHESAYQNMPLTVDYLEKSNSVDSIEIFNRQGATLYDSTLKTNKESSALESIQVERSRPLTFEEKAQKLAVAQRVKEMQEVRGASREEKRETNALFKNAESAVNKDADAYEYYPERLAENRKEDITKIDQKLTQQNKQLPSEQPPRSGGKHDRREDKNVSRSDSKKNSDDGDQDAPTVKTTSETKKPTDAKSHGTDVGPNKTTNSKEQPENLRQAAAGNALQPSEQRPEKTESLREQASAPAESKQQQKPLERSSPQGESANQSQAGRPDKTTTADQSDDFRQTTEATPHQLSDTRPANSELLQNGAASSAKSSDPHNTPDSPVQQPGPQQPQPIPPAPPEQILATSNKPEVESKSHTKEWEQSKDHRETDPRQSAEAKPPTISQSSPDREDDSSRKTDPDLKSDTQEPNQSTPQKAERDAQAPKPETKNTENRHGQTSSQPGKSENLREAAGGGKSNTSKNDEARSLREQASHSASHKDEHLDRPESKGLLDAAAAPISKSESEDERSRRR